MTPLSPYDPEIEALWHAVEAAGVRSVAMVSAQSGEGTTLIASALARRAGLAGPPSLLVDLNLIRPNIARLLGLRPAPGEIVPIPAMGIAVLANVCLDDADRWRDPTALAEQIQRWSEAWGLVVVDTAPLLSRDPETIPPTAVARGADSAVLTALAGRTPISALREARNRLDACGARLLGTVMNDRDNPSLLNEMERETYRLSRVMPRAMAMLRGYVRKLPVLTVRA